MISAVCSVTGNYGGRGVFSDGAGAMDSSVRLGNASLTSGCFGSAPVSDSDGIGAAAFLGIFEIVSRKGDKLSRFNPEDERSMKGEFTIQSDLDGIRMAVGVMARLTSGIEPPDRPTGRGQFSPVFRGRNMRRAPRMWLLKEYVILFSWVSGPPMPSSQNPQARVQCK